METEIDALRALLLNQNAQIATMAVDIKELRAAVLALAFPDESSEQQQIRARQIARALKYEDSE